jgi:hypothetical protein
MSINILKYESEVWKTADLLIGAGANNVKIPALGLLSSVTQA